MNPLFPNFDRSIQQAAREEFQRTELGKLLSSRSRSPADVKRLAGLVARYSRGKSPSSLGEIKDLIFKAMVDQVTKRMGFLGQILGPLIRPAGTSLVKDLDRELAAAANLLKAFGYGVTPPELIESAPGVPVKKRRPGQSGQTGGGGGQAGSVAPWNPIPRPVPGPSGPKVLPPLAGNSTSKSWQNNTVTVRVGQTQYKISPTDPMLTGEMIPVSSSNVHSIGFLWNQDNPTLGVLKVRFRARARDGGQRPTSGGPLYHYYGVNPSVFKAFQLASSKGKFVWDKLRVRGTVSGHQYQYQLMGIEKDGYVPRKATRIGPNEYYIGRQVRSTGGKQYTSALQDELVQRWQPGKPNRGTPNRGTPNRGRP